MRSPTTAAYAVHVSWDGSGAFSGTYDDVTSDTIVPPTPSGRAVTIERGRQTERSLGGAMVPAAGWTLTNVSRRYSSQFGGSPIFGAVVPGRPCRIAGRVGDPLIRLDDAVVRLDDPDVLLGGQVDVSLFLGRIGLPDEDPNPNARTVTMAALGRLQRLISTRVTSPIYFNLSIGAVIVNLMTLGGFSEVVDYAIDAELVSNGRVLSYYVADDRSLYDAIVQLIVTEGPSAAIYERGDGVIAVEGRNYRLLTDRSTTIQASFKDVLGEPGELFHTALRLNSGLLDIINRAAFDVVPRTLAAVAVIWTYGATLTLSSTGTAAVTAKPSDLFANAVTPAVGTDFTLSTGSVTVALSRTSGVSTTISFSGGTAAAVISGLQLRAQLFAPAGGFRAENDVDASDSIAAYGEQSWSPQVAVYDGLATAEATSLCNAVVNAYKDPRPIVEWAAENADLAHLNAIFQAEISSRYHVIDAQSGVNFDVYAERLRHAIGLGGRHTLVFGAEKVAETSPGIWDADGVYWNLARWGN